MDVCLCLVMNYVIVCVICNAEIGDNTYFGRRSLLFDCHGDD